MSTNTKRIIARLDIKGPNLIKGIELDGLRVMGKASDFAKVYYQGGADELIYQDVVASLYGRNSLQETIKKTAREVFIPLTVAGGIRSIDDIRDVLNAGADKVAINTAATSEPELITRAASKFGSQCIVASIEAYRKGDGQYQAWVNYGRETTKLDALTWAQRVVELGAGEILVTSINQDGTGRGFDHELVGAIAELVDVPVIASGGAGTKQDVQKLLSATKVDAVAIGSMFHYNYCTSLNSESEYTKSLRGLRMGEQNDTGNMDYVYFGYGGSRDLFVSPCSIEELKVFLRESGERIRL